MDSEDSSPDDLCRCGHGRRQHPALAQGRCTGEVLTPAGDDRNNCPCKAFWPARLVDLRSAPADAKPAGQSGCATPFTCYVGGACGRPEDCAYGCREAADELSDEHREPECGCGNEECEICTPIRHLIGEPEAPDDGLVSIPHPYGGAPTVVSVATASSFRRPPYAVAYALASGELYEVALPGDAVATVEGGVLKISHPQGVAHIIQVKPMGEQ